MFKHLHYTINNTDFQPYSAVKCNQAPVATNKPNDQPKRRADEYAVAKPLDEKPFCVFYFTKKYDKQKT